MTAVTVKEQLALLDKALRLELYVEYSNETWNGMFKQSHYCHVGRAGDRGAWGAIEFTGQPLAEAHKHRALVEWARDDRTTEPPLSAR